MEFGQKKRTFCSCCCIVVSMIAVIEMVLCIAGMVKISYPLLTILTMRHVSWLDPVSRTGRGELLEDGDFAEFSQVPLFLFTVVLIALFFFIVLPGFVMGIVLLVGAWAGRPSYLRAWLLFAFLLLLLFLGLALRLSTTKDLAPLGILLLAMICVQIHRKGMEAELQMLLSMSMPFGQQQQQQPYPPNFNGMGGGGVPYDDDVGVAYDDHMVAIGYDDGVSEASGEYAKCDGAYDDSRPEDSVGVPSELLGGSLVDYASPSKADFHKKGKNVDQQTGRK